MKVLTFAFLFLFGTGLLWGQFDKNKEIVFTSIEEALRDPLRIYHLDLSNQSLEKFPMEVLRFENLISLNLARNNISSLEGIDFSFLKKLEEIYLYDNKFKDFPYEPLAQAKNLIIIDFGENDLKEIKSEINTFRYVEELVLRSNRISKIAMDVKLPYLKILSLERNHLTEFTRFVEQSPKLEYLNLYGNSIKRIPISVNSATKLKYLNIGDNPIDSISEDIFLRKLKTLILDWVDLSKESVTIGFVKKSTLLESFSIEHCQLHNFPEIIFDLPRLKELSIMNNELDKIDENIYRNKKLSKLWVGGNKISEENLILLKQKISNLEIVNN